MWYLIVTARSLIWMLLALFSSLLLLTSLLSPSWLVAAPETITVGNETIKFRPSLGIYAKCGKPIGNTYPICTLLAVRGLSADPHIYPNVWKAGTVFLAMGIFVMSLTVCTGLMSCCFQSICKKSIFNISGAAQAIAGIFYIIAVMLYPTAWGISKVQKLCGRDASPFYPGDCSLGTGLWLAIIGTVLTFVSACLSASAEKSTSSDKVQDKIYEGQTLICLT
ncbi:LHFPL tetraspan subfamily member 2a protein [Leptinotarsa decemlineata]|uniref:LHFPL tetraspan subfamily member 2a protein n=1 Tax=Leptinotarsa decemlineata TaxID=7539 RepID=UPI000C2554EC|nr:LHFPL tetraspan subfamily member 2a protein [Leptinotarsa decemlineata]XP_023030269.1 LHFPL tetraspan subfamily member 2a protein [Leptinotarsa decemlineata]